MCILRALFAYLSGRHFSAHFPNALTVKEMPVWFNSVKAAAGKIKEFPVFCRLFAFSSVPFYIVEPPVSHIMRIEKQLNHNWNEAESGCAHRIHTSFCIATPGAIWIYKIYKQMQWTGAEMCDLTLMLCGAGNALRTSDVHQVNVEMAFECAFWIRDQENIDFF